VISKHFDVSTRAKIFRIQDAAAGSATDGIVRERNEFVTQNGAFTEPADGGCHAVPCHAIAAGLRPILLLQIEDGMLWRRRQ
jgi:hypothetical protein